LEIALLPENDLHKELDWQDIGSKLSRTKTFGVLYDPMSRFRHEPFREGSPALRSLSQALEWSYGYRGKFQAGKKNVRRAASAGALYPTELFVLISLKGEWKCLYYCFLTHSFYDNTGADPPSLSRSLGLESGQTAVLLVSILWKTVQKYGARGYRYCLLDSGNVLSNLVQSLRVLQKGCEVVWAGPKAGTAGALGLRHGEIVTTLFKIGRITGPSRGTAPPLAGWGSKVNPADSPRFNPILSRIIRFHQKTLDPEVKRGDFAEILPLPFRDFSRMMRDRRSTDGFSGKIDQPNLDRVLDRIAFYSRSRKEGPHRLKISFWVAPLLPSPSFQNRLKTGLDGTCSISPGPVDPQGLVDACNGQAFVSQAWFVLVLGVGRKDLASHSYVEYRRSLLEVGFLCGCLYRDSALARIGTTTLGAFREARINALLSNDSVLPIVIQAFGGPKEPRHKKDLTKMVL
jgi:hypothetical protein